MSADVSTLSQQAEKAANLQLALEQLLKDCERFELREIGEVEAVIDDGDFKETVALDVREAEKVHGGIVHTHHQLELVGLGGEEHVAMEWGRVAEDALAEIEVIAR
jgi:hypothetical protein